MKYIQRYLLIQLVSWFLIPVCVEAQLAITPDRPDGIYKTGETVHWTLHKSDTIDLKSARYVLKNGGLKIVEQGPISFSSNEQELDYTFNSPGTILLEVCWGVEDSWKDKAVGGAVADPALLELSAERPPDFDAFWNSKLDELAEVPINPVLQKEESGIDGVEYWKIIMDNIRGTHIRGQLSRPVKGGKLPALLIVQWAGIYPLQKNWVTDRSRDGWLVMNINAHDLPIDKEPEYYREQSEGPLRNYPTIGNDDRETSYFLRMYLSCYRAADYLSRRSDWNGKTLVVMGDSQGGQQALMTAGLYPGITASLALVPAGFDMLGPEIGRKGGWPQWYDQTEGKDPAKVHQASRYFDVANFISNVKCPVLVGVGLLDETCPPEGILAGLNLLVTPKEVLILPRSGHQDRQGSQKAYRDRREKVWLPTLRTGKKAPVNK
jgi:cephalosporin-C deacetylase